MAAMGNMLVTGGAGFMSSHIAAELLKRKHEVLVIDVSTSAPTSR